MSYLWYNVCNSTRKAATYEIRTSEERRTNRSWLNSKLLYINNLINISSALLDCVADLITIQSNALRLPSLVSFQILNLKLINKYYKPY